VLLGGPLLTLRPDQEPEEVLANGAAVWGEVLGHGSGSQQVHRGMERTPPETVRVESHRVLKTGLAEQVVAVWVGR
jgi:hypothetical protein